LGLARISEDENKALFGVKKSNKRELYANRLYRAYSGP
jgi:hypothetical protein